MTSASSLVRQWHSSNRLRCLPGTQSHMVSILSHSFHSTINIFSSLRFFNDVELKNSTKHKIEAKQNVYTLTVNKCDHPDVGTYRVHVDNGIDHTDQTAKLSVGGKLSLLPSYSTRCSLLHSYSTRCSLLPSYSTRCSLL